MKKQYLLIAATAVVTLVTGTRAARYLQLQRERPPIADTFPGRAIPEGTQPVTVDTSIGEVTFGSNHKFVPSHRPATKGNAIFVYLPGGYDFDHEYVLRLSLAFLYTTKGHFRMEPVPSIAEGGDPNASAIISAGSNYAAWCKNKAGEESQTWSGTPLEYKYYIGEDPAPNFDQTVELVTFLIEHPRYVEQVYRKIASLVEMTNLAK